MGIVSERFIGWRGPELHIPMVEACELDEPARPVAAVHAKRCALHRERSGAGSDLRGRRAHM